MQRIAFLLFGFLLAACLFSYCPSLIIEQRPVQYDTISGGGVIPALPATGMQEDSIEHDTVWFPLPGSGNVSIGLTDTVQAGQPGAWVPKYFQSVYSDSLIRIRATAELATDTCKVKNIRIDYTLLYPRMDKPFIPMPPVEKSNGAEIVGLAELWTNGKQTGLYLSLQKLKGRNVFGAGYDPFNKALKFSAGISLIARK